MESSKTNLSIVKFKEIFREIMEREPTPKERLTYMDYFYNNGPDGLKNILMSTSEYSNKRLILWTRNCGRVNLEELASSKSDVNVKFYMTLGIDSMAHISKDYLLSLVYLGANVKVEVVDITSNIILEQEITATCMENNIEYSKVLINTRPELWRDIVKNERKINPNVMIYTFIGWYTDEIPEEWKQLLEDVDRLIVPTKWNKDIFDKYFNKPIYHIPYVIDIDYSPAKVIVPFNEDDYVFYNIGKNDSRKNLYSLINAYFQEFSNEDRVHLFIKTDKINEDEIKDLRSQFNKTLAPLTLSNAELTDQEILYLHSACHCYVSVSKSEKVCLALCQAAMLGKSVICVKYGGHIEYLKNVTFLNVKMSKCDFSYMNLTVDSQWATYEQDDLRDSMRYAYENKLKGNSNTRKNIKELYTHKKIGRKLLDVL